MTNDPRVFPRQSRVVAGATSNGVSSAVYGLAFIGAALYNVQHATSFWNGVLGCLEALVWPALLSYKLLGFLGR